MRLPAVLLLSAALLTSQVSAGSNIQESRARLRQKILQLRQDIGSLGGFLPSFGGGQSQGHGHHRLSLIFPLLMMIAGRLASIVPMMLSGLIGIGLLVLFAKKAFIVSMLTLALVLWEKWKKPMHPPAYEKEEIHVFPESPTHAHYFHPFKDPHRRFRMVEKSKPTTLASKGFLTNGVNDPNETFFIYSGY